MFVRRKRARKIKAAAASITILFLPNKLEDSRSPRNFRQADQCASISTSTSTVQVIINQRLLSSVASYLSRVKLEVKEMNSRDGHECVPDTPARLTSCDTDFHFVTVQNADEVRNRQIQRAARSYAGKRGHQKRTARLIQGMNHFRISTPQNMATRPAAGPSRLQERTTNPSVAIGISRLDPFDTLAVDARRLQELLSHRT
jgi:hypothetical protein